MDSNLPNIGKLNALVLNTNSELMQIHKNVMKFLKEQDEDSLEDITESIDNFNTMSEALQNCIKKILEESVDIDSDQIDVIPSENGFKL